MDRSAATNELAGAADRVVALLGTVDDPAAPAIGSWSIADTAAHLAFVMEHLPEYLLGTEVIPGRAAEFERLADAHTAVNDVALTSERERELPALATRMRTGVDRLIEAAGRLDGEQRCQWFGGVDVSADFYLAVAINELLVHGRDMARAARQPWRVDRSTAALIVEAFLEVSPHYVDHAAAKGFHASCELRIRGGPTVYLTFDNGALAVSNERRGPVDCHISADPWAFMLVTYGRVGQWNAALRGKVVTWGRRPWLGLKLGRLSATP
jgi:uncharacterized protein (TIGR03083 family)